MSRFTDPGRRPLLHRRRPVTVAVGIVLITVGLVLRFALTAGFPDVATCHAHGISTVLTADRGFDAVPGLHRVDPADLPEVRTLLARS